MGIIVGDIDGFIDSRRRQNNFNIAIALLVYFLAIFASLLEYKGADTPMTAIQILSSLIVLVIIYLFASSTKLVYIVGLEGGFNLGSEKIKNTITKKEKNVYYFTIIAIFLVLLFLFSQIDFFYGFVIGFIADGSIALALMLGIHDNDRRIHWLWEESESKYRITIHDRL